MYPCLYVSMYFSISPFNSLNLLFITINLLITVPEFNSLRVPYRPPAYPSFHAADYPSYNNGEFDRSFERCKEIVCSDWEGWMRRWVLGVEKKCTQFLYAVYAISINLLHLVYLNVHPNSFFWLIMPSIVRSSQLNISIMWLMRCVLLQLFTIKKK